MSDIVERLRDMREYSICECAEGPHLISTEAPVELAQEAADTITTLRAEVERLNSELKAALTDLEELRDPKLSHMRLENGQLDMALVSPVIEGLATAMGGWFVAGGAKNYAEMRLHDRHETGAVYVVTVQKSGAKTPHDCRREAEAELTTLRADNERLVKALEPFAEMGRELMGRQHSRTAVIHKLGAMKAIMVSDLFAAAHALAQEKQDG